MNPGNQIVRPYDNRWTGSGELSDDMRTNEIFIGDIVTPDGNKCLSAVAPFRNFPFTPNTTYTAPLDKDIDSMCVPGFHFYPNPENLITNILLAGNNKNDSVIKNVSTTRKQLLNNVLNAQNCKEKFVINPKRKIYVFSTPTRQTTKEYSQEIIDYLRDTFPDRRYICNIKSSTAKNDDTFSYNFGNIEISRMLDDTTYSIITPSGHNKKHVGSNIIMAAKLYMILPYDIKISILEKSDSTLILYFCKIVCMDTMLEFANLYMSKNKFNKITDNIIRTKFTKFNKLLNTYNITRSAHILQIIEWIHRMVNGMNHGVIIPKYKFAKKISDIIRDMLNEYHIITRDQARDQDHNDSINLFDFVKKIHNDFEIDTDYSKIPNILCNYK